MVGDVVVFGPRDPAGGEEELVELHAQRFASHVLHGQVAADGQRRTFCVNKIGSSQQTKLMSEKKIHLRA